MTQQKKFRDTITANIKQGIAEGIKGALKGETAQLIRKGFKVLSHKFDQWKKEPEKSEKENSKHHT